MATRRWVLALTPALLLAPRLAFAQELTVASALEAIGKAFAPATGLAAHVTTVVAALQPSTVKTSDRPAVRNDLDALDGALTGLLMSNDNVIRGFDYYIRTVRTDGFSDATHAPMWAGIVSDLQRVAREVASVQAVQQKAKWLTATLSPDQERELDETLLARTAIVQKLSVLPAPRSVLEVDQLATVNVRYKELRAQLAELRTAVNAAQARLV